MTSTTKIAELQELLSIEDSELAEDLLSQSGWNLQGAVECYFDRQQNPQSTQNTQQYPPNSSVANVGLGGTSRLSASPLSPLSLLYNLYRGLVYLAVKILRLPIWLYSFVFNYNSLSQPPTYISPQDANSLLISSITQAVNSVQGPSSTTTALSNAGNTNTPTQPSLPAFYTGTPSEAIKEARNTAQFGIIVVIDGSETSTQFKHSTLANAHFVRLVEEHQCLVYVGDVTVDKHAYEYATGCSVVTSAFPYVQLYSLQALPTRSNPLVSTPTMSLLGSVSGGDTLGDSFVNFLSSRYLRRVGAYLGRLRLEKYEAQRRSYLQEAAEKEETDRMQRDAERVMRRREEVAQEKRLAEVAAREREITELENVRREAALVEYKRWLKGTLPNEPPNGIKLAFKLPDGRRIVRGFAPQTPLHTLYTYIDTIDVEHASNTPHPPLTDYSPQFNLFTSYPRRLIPDDMDRMVEDIDVLSKGGSVAVESTVTCDDSEESDGDEED